MNIKTFLFDKQRTGRLLFAIGCNSYPTEVWKYKLPNSTPYGPESTAVFDQEGNLYFGCHDGVFYSLTKYGKLRWIFNTFTKIYSSPSIVNEKYVVFSSGDGIVYCLFLDGTYNWSYDMKLGVIKSFGEKFQDRINDYVNKINFFFTRINNRESYFRIIRKHIACWSSVNISGNNAIICTGYGKGLFEIGVQNGDLLWSYDLGKPRYFLSGVALTENEDIIAAAQKRYLFSISLDHNLNWKFDSKYIFDCWANPSIDVEYGTIYFPVSKGNDKGVVFALDYTGKVKWKVYFNSAIRGSVAISYSNYVLVASFDGYLTFLDKNNGSIINAVRLSICKRALWTTPAIDLMGNILISSKQSSYTGSIFCLDKTGKILWEYKCGKALSVPILDKDGKLYFGTWDGDYICLKT